MRKETLCRALKNGRVQSAEPYHFRCPDFLKAAAMFKIIAVVVIGIFGGIGFFGLGREAYALAALLLGIGALLDYSQKRTAAPLH